ncbi:MAG: DUF1684 domain-containing protein [Cytophagaceae bacterium]|nr:DUF1684 domain-containing protein [Cytophagaceae bacterium]
METKDKYNALKRKGIIRYIIVGAVIAVVLGLILTGINSNSYEETIETFRQQKDANFRQSIKSPITEKDTFYGLNYFPINPEFKVKAFITYLRDTTRIFLPRNDGKVSTYVAYLKADFKIKQQNLSLILYKHPEEESNAPTLFLPFYDATNGESTYEGGRYLDVPLTNNQTIDIDFNYAYNPYCVYNYQYSCPIPPISNKLPIAIPVGEKMYKR